MNVSDIQLSSQFSYQKIAISGNQTLSVPFNTNTTLTVPHNLGYVPTAKIWYEPVVYNGSTYVASNQIWPLTGYQFGDTVAPVVTFQLATLSYAYLDSTNLYIVLLDTSGGTVNIPVYWRIYYDA